MGTEEDNRKGTEKESWKGGNEAAFARASQLNIKLSPPLVSSWK